MLGSDSRTSSGSQNSSSKKRYETDRNALYYKEEPFRNILLLRRGTVIAREQGPKVRHDTGYSTESSEYRVARTSRVGFTFYL